MLLSVARTLPSNPKWIRWQRLFEDAIAALQYKDADYTKVDEAVAKANALNKDKYKDFSGVEAAVKAVVRNKNITE